MNWVRGYYILLFIFQILYAIIALLQMTMPNMREMIGVGRIQTAKYLDVSEEFVEVRLDCRHRAYKFFKNDYFLMIQLDNLTKL